MVTKPKVVAIYASNKIAPDLFAHEIKAGGLRYGTCIVCPERNNHGFATLTVLKDIYYNIYRDEQDKLGWQTNMASKPRILHELRTAIHEGLIEVSDAALKSEIVSYPAQDLNEMNRYEEDETSGHYDRVMALAFAWAMRNRAMPTQIYEHKDDDGYRREEKQFDRFALFSELE